MSLWVKVCANTSLEDARMAAEAGADAVGFVFAASPRQVTVEQVARIAPQLAAPVETIGVFVEAELAAIVEDVERCGLTGVQLHSGGAGFPALLRARFGAGLRILRVVHFGAGAVDELAQAAAEPAVDAVLVDSRRGAVVGGTGVAFDWHTARGTIFAPERSLRLIAAGGLRPENVGEAIGTLRPWGVDVASGVEEVPGRKDAAKVRAFVANARAAERAISG